MSVENRPRRSDAGETLLEITLAVMILGIGTTAVLGALGVAIENTAVQRKQTVSGRVLDSFAEYLKNENTSPYVTCSGAPVAYDGYRDTFVDHVRTSTTSSVHQPDIASYTLTVAVEAGVPQAAGADPSMVFQATCPASDSGVQRLTLKVASSDGRAAESVQITKWQRT